MSNGWSTSPMFRIGYMEELKPVDASIAELLAKRQHLTKGKRFLPPAELITAWAEQFDIHPDLLAWSFRTFTQREQTRGPVDLGNLLTIFPLMKRQSVNGCLYTLTHLEQYENGSKLHLAVKLETPDAHQISHLEVQLTLEIEPSTYTVIPFGRQGGGAQASAQFLVTPALPENLDGIHFALVPAEGRDINPPHIPRILNDPVHFS